MKIVVTGAGGLIGWHASARLHAINCTARFRGEKEPYTIVELDRATFNDDTTLTSALRNAGLVLHFAGVNRATGKEQETGNIALAQRLEAALSKTNSSATVVYSNSTHEIADNAYGRGKRRAAEILSADAKNRRASFANLILPHVFGEGGRPFYNNVTARCASRSWTAINQRSLRMEQSNLFMQVMQHRRPSI